MFDLNEKKFGGSVIFNNGQGGVVKNVDISVEKRKQDEPDNHPDYKIIVSDGTAQINQGFYYPKAKSDKTEDQNAQAAVREVGRVIHVAKAIVGNDYTFPTVSNAKEAYDTLFTLIGEKAPGVKVNVFTSYGTTGYPGKFLGLRYFNFIEPAGTDPSRLKATPNDLLERIAQDAPTDSATGPKKESWV